MYILNKTLFERKILFEKLVFYYKVLQNLRFKVHKYY